MAAKVRIKLDHDGIRELLMSAPIQAECERQAKRIAEKAGEGFEVKPTMKMGFGGGRVGTAVYTATYAARKAEATDKVLTKAVRS